MNTFQHLAAATELPEQVALRSEFEGHIQSARDNYAGDDIQIDDKPLVSDVREGVEKGVWVNAWVWVASNQDGE